MVISVESKELSPEELAAKCQAGCRDSFELLIERFETRIFHFIFRFVGNLHDAEDLTQDTFVSAFRSIHRYEPAFAFSTWLFTIAKRAALSHYRAHRPDRYVPTDGDPPIEHVDSDDPSVLLASKDEQGSIWDIARGLKPKQHEALWLRYGEGFSVAETARIMDTNQIHVKVLLHRGRAHLAKKLRLKHHSIVRATQPGRENL